ncbi:hypothetical protein ASE75_12790 [Sphingomonas sp. Leaf17]|uniref:hypothetical protein n=1 Tax=Sphingomonas sp. Leaf17 TaxID=1735683 RepID=UPI0006F22D00|nr:hypothetical protein [Sphingomonas sp. Leaf17]KQM63332.1 hypothetical protein ASE75_12790 [Sphingomonas sp. Leaf17]
MDTKMKLEAWWAQTGANIKTRPTPPGVINSIARRYDLILPQDFHSYLTMGSPVADNWDDEMGNWWPVDRIKNISDEYEHTLPSFIPNKGKRFLFFLDHCIWCWAWAISCEQGATFGKVALIGGENERFVADTFSEFVERYISNWIAVS